MEHRCGIRHCTAIAVVITAASGAIGKGVMRQLSISGALIQSSLPLRPDSMVMVRLSPIGRHRSTARVGLRGQIVRRTAAGFAIEWLDFAPDAVRALIESPDCREAQPVPGPQQARQIQAGHSD